MKIKYLIVALICSFIFVGCGPTESEIADIALLQHDSLASLNQKELAMEMMADSMMAKEEIESANREFLNDHLSQLKDEFERSEQLIESLAHKKGKAAFQQKSLLEKKLDLLQLQIAEIEGEIK